MKVEKASDTNEAFAQDLPLEQNMSIQFRGSTTVTGTYKYLAPGTVGMVDGDTLFFTVNKESLENIPHLDNEGIEQNWFMFTNQEKAKEIFNIDDTDKEGTATIAIKDFVFFRYPTSGAGGSSATIVSEK